MTRSTNKLCNSLMYDDEGRLALLQHENIVMPLVSIVKMLNPTLQIVDEKLDYPQKLEDTNDIYFIMFTGHCISGQIRPVMMIAVINKL